MFRSRTLLNAAIIVSILIAALFAGFYLYNTFRIRHVIIATNEEGSDSYDFMVALVNEVKLQYPRLDIKIVPTKGSTDVMDMLRKREADFGVAQIDAVESLQVRTVALLYPQAYHLIVRDNSGVQVFTDLRGKTIGTSSKSGGSYTSLLEVMKYYGLKEKDVNIIAFEDDNKRDEAFINGDVDALFRTTTLGKGSIRDLFTETDAHLIAFDQYAAMKVLYPNLAQYTIPKGIYHAVDPVVPARDTLTVGVPTALFANSGVAPDVVQIFTQVLFEQKKDIVRQQREAVFISSPMTDDYFGPSIHPGALRYYNREQPSFLERYYNEISLLFTIGPILASLYFALRSRFVADQKTKASQHNIGLASLLAEFRSDSNLETTRATEQKLLDALNRALKDLDDGLISASDLQMFSLVWEKAMDAVHYRENALLQAGPQEAQKNPNGKK